MLLIASCHRRLLRLLGSIRWSDNTSWRISHTVELQQLILKMAASGITETLVRISQGGEEDEGDVLLPVDTAVLPVELCDMKFFLCPMSWEFMSRYEHMSRYKVTYYRAMI